MHFDDVMGLFADRARVKVTSRLYTDSASGEGVIVVPFIVLVGLVVYIFVFL